jgi:3(or 17)beta-hydroxysteroid dehydrogenase
MRLANKIALVTGAGSGLGEGMARRLAEEGALVVLSDIDFASVQRVAAAIVDAGGRAEAEHQDVTDEPRWTELVDAVLARHGRLDVLVNNAGIALTGSAEDTSLADWQRTLRVNLDGVFLGTREGIRVMKGRGGSIVNISSIAGIVGEPLSAAYSASKGGVRLFTKSAALHCAGQGYSIRVNSVHPGFMLTPLVENALAAMHSTDAEVFRSRVEDSIPVRAMGEPRDVANGVLFLASDESHYVTGAELVIDGGYSAR